jgi:hypothetical protein
LATPRINFIVAYKNMREREREREGAAIDDKEMETEERYAK